MQKYFFRHLQFIRLQLENFTFFFFTLKSSVKNSFESKTNFVRKKEKKNLSKARKYFPTKNLSLSSNLSSQARYIFENPFSKYVHSRCSLKVRVMFVYSLLPRSSIHTSSGTKSFFKAR